MILKLVVQIPCYNEAESLPKTLADLPAHLPGVGVIEVLVIDDGSEDGTAEVARALGASVVRFSGNRGFARAFSTGLVESLRRGADVVVNTDGDHQYRGEDLPALLAPILEGRADMVVGDRQVQRIAHFSPLKRLLQRLGSAVVRWLSGADIPDAPSGYRAFSREVATRLSVHTSFSPTLETLIHARQMGFRVVAVPIQTNPPTRPSRLFSSIPEYVARQGLTLARVMVFYRPLEVFSSAAGFCLALGLAIGVRFLWYHLTLEQAGHTQSLILGGVLLVLAFLLMIAGLLADQIQVNRRMLDEALYRLRQMDR